MKSYLNLIPASAKAHKKENRMTVFCIVLAVFLVTGIFSMADMEARCQKIRIIQQYGDWHINLRNISEKDKSLIAARSDVEASARYAVINDRFEENYSVNATGLSGKQAVILGADESFYTDIMHCDIISGSFPDSNDEIMLTNSANYAFNIDIGDTIEITSPSGNVFTYTVSGFISDTAAVDRNDAVGISMDFDTFRQLYTDEYESDFPENYISFYVKLDDGCAIRKSVNDIKGEYNISSNNISENNMLLGAVGESGHSYMRGLYIIAGVLFLLVSTCGILMIASSMNSSVAQKTEFFGLLRCIGASKKQIKRLVHLEALNFCRAAIPIGVLGGVAITWFLCAVLRILSGSYFAMMPVFGVSTVGIIAGIAVGFLTVILAARAPAKRASKVSPLATVSGNSETICPVKKTANTKFLKIETALGIHHAKQSKKNFLLMIGSFAVSIVLFFGFSAMVEFLYYGITPLQPYQPDVSITSSGYARDIDCDITNKLEDLDFVKRAYGRMSAYNINAEIDDISRKSQRKASINLISYDDSQFEWARDSEIVSGNRGAVDQVMNESGCVLAAYSPLYALQAGDKIKTELGEVTVAAVYTSLPFAYGAESVPLICSESTFRSLVGDSTYTFVDVQLESSATDEDLNHIRTLAADSKAEFSDLRMQNREARGIYYSFALFIYSFLAVIALITIFNIMNSISMSVSARIKEYCSMRAIGMSVRQIKRMIRTEALTYSVFGSFVGCILGLPLKKFIFEKLITSYFGAPWNIPFSIITVVAPFAIIASLTAVHKPTRRIKKMSICDTIRM